MMKFALFLVCALVAVQGFQARSVERNDFGQGETIGDRVYIIKKMKQFVGEVNTDISRRIHKINTMVAEISIKYQEFLGDILVKSEDLTDSAGEVGRKCLESHNDQFFTLLEFHLNIHQDCIDEANTYTSALKEQMNAVVTKVNDFSEDFNEGLYKCWNVPMQPTNLAKCLSKLIESTNDQLVELEEEVVNNSFLAEQEAEENVSAVVVCISKASEEAAKKKAEFLGSIKKCVATLSTLFV